MQPSNDLQHHHSQVILLGARFDKTANRVTQARSQFRGTLKRRAYLVHADQPLAAGQEVFAPDEPEQATGTVVQAAAAPGGGWDALVSMQIASASRNDLFAHAKLAEGQSADATQGVALQVLPLPYALLDDI